VSDQAKRQPWGTTGRSVYYTIRILCHASYSRHKSCSRDGGARGVGVHDLVELSAHGLDLVVPLLQLLGVGVEVDQAVNLVNAALQNTVYTPFSGVPRFPIPRSANSDSPLKHHDLYGKQQLRRRYRAPLQAILRLMALRLKACILYSNHSNQPKIPHCGQGSLAGLADHGILNCKFWDQ